MGLLWINNKEPVVQEAQHQDLKHGKNDFLSSGLISDFMPIELLPFSNRVKHVEETNKRRDQGPKPCDSWDAAGCDLQGNLNAVFEYHKFDLFVGINLGLLLVVCSQVFEVCWHVQTLLLVKKLSDDFSYFELQTKALRKLWEEDGK